MLIEAWIYVNLHKYSTGEAQISRINELHKFSYIGICFSIKNIRIMWTVFGITFEWKRSKCVKLGIVIFVGNIPSMLSHLDKV